MENVTEKARKSLSIIFPAHVTAASVRRVLFGPALDDFGRF